jgi:hypothetical protein
LLLLPLLRRCVAACMSSPTAKRGVDSEDETRPGKLPRREPAHDIAAAGDAPTVRGNDGAAAGSSDDAPPAPPPGADQVTAALAKIAKHIGNPAKFSKTSGLLRTLMDAVGRSHRTAYFAALSAAFADPAAALDAQLRRDYGRLVKSAQLRAELLSKQQQAQLEVYAVWGLLRSELFTDDSFAFSKVLSRIKAAISELPDADEEQEAAWARLHPGAAAPTKGSAPGGAGERDNGGQVELRQPEAEADPFGLDALLAGQQLQLEQAMGQQQPEQQQPEQVSSAPHGSCQWDGPELLVMRKQALLDCLTAAKEHCHKLAWARTGVELLIEEVAKPAAQGGLISRFVVGQREELASLLRFVNAERTARRAGVVRRPGGKGTGEYTTAFERARNEWGNKEWVSARGKVGGQGDSGANMWLG